jgi:hypothetical protein
MAAASWMAARKWWPACRSGRRCGGVLEAPEHALDGLAAAVKDRPAFREPPRLHAIKNKNARGIDALKLYRAQYDDKLQALRPRPVHDWTSHAADSFRYLALTLDRKATHSGFYRRIDYPQHGVV